MVSRVEDEGGFGRQAAYSRAVRSGLFVAVSATASIRNGEVDPVGDAYGQAKSAIERALAAASEVGAQVEDVLRTRLLLAPGCDWREVVRAHREVFADSPPANSTYFVGGFIPEGVLVEVELDAVLSSEA